MKTNQLPHDGSVEAEYADGYIHSETERGDVSAYEPETRNVFHDILHGLPEADHGKMVRFTVFYKDMRYDIDWTQLPDNARPIRFKHFQQKFRGSQPFGPRLLLGVDFGYQYNDESGKNVQHVNELR